MFGDQPIRVPIRNTVVDGKYFGFTPSPVNVPPVGAAGAVVLLGAVLDKVDETVLRTLLNDKARIANS